MEAAEHYQRTSLSVYFRRLFGHKREALRTVSCSELSKKTSQPTDQRKILPASWPLFPRRLFFPFLPSPETPVIVLERARVIRENSPQGKANAFWGVESSPFWAPLFSSSAFSAFPSTQSRALQAVGSVISEHNVGKVNGQRLPMSTESSRFSLSTCGWHSIRHPRQFLIATHVYLSVRVL